MIKDFDFNECVDYINSLGPETRVYIGCDSERLKVNKIWHADYTTVVVVHINGNQGCRVFGKVEREIDYDAKRHQPTTRLMNEVYKASAMYMELFPFIADKHVEVHLDLNPNERYNSSHVVQQAIGYVRGVCQTTPLIKPDAWAASYCADRYKEVSNYTKGVCHHMQ